MKPVAITFLAVCSIFFYPKFATATCTAPSALTISNVNETGADILWPATPGAIYQVHLDTTTTINVNHAVSITNNYHSYYQTLKCRTKYYVSVRVICAANDTSAWTMDSFTTYKCCNPPLPMTFPTITSSQVTTYITGTINTTAYEYLFSITYLTPGSGTHGTLTTNTAFLEQGLIADTRYYVCVRSQCDSGSAPVSSWSCDTVRTRPICEQVDSINKQTLNDTTLLISWPAVAHASTYEYTAKLASQQNVPVQKTSATQALITGLSADSVYSICVRANCNMNYNTPWTCDNVHMTLGVMPIATPKSIHIYPNPAKQEVYADIQQAGINTQLQLVNILGSVIHSYPVKTGHNTLNITDVPAGLYYIRYADKDQTISYKLQVE